MVLGIGGLCAAVFGPPIRRTYVEAIAGKAQIDFAKQYFETEQFDRAGASLDQATTHFETARAQLNGRVRVLRAIPYVRRQLDAVENLMVAATQSTSAVRRLTDFAQSIFTIVEGDGTAEVNLATISEEQKVAVLDEMIHAGPLLQGAKADIDLTEEFIARIPEHGIAGPIRRVVEPLRAELPRMQHAIDTIIPIVQTLPQIAGHPVPQTYLFLLQNNTELRPTGGFIGTYGVLTVDAGEIDAFRTDNVYNLDVPAKDRVHETPPEPIRKYLRQEQWFLRDSNWSPDFPTAAAKALEFYRLEGGTESFDGVIAVTPTLIESLLALTGEITIDGVVFNEQNVVDTLEFQVEKGFYRQGIAQADRKEIIGTLSSKLLDALLALPQSRWPDLLQTLQRNLDEKQVLLYFDHPDVQQVITEQAWSGHLRETDEDFLMVVDANMASLKTDLGIDRSISYAVSRDADGSLVADLSIRYQNNGSFNWKTTRYRTYTRVYVPQGSVLLSSSGTMEDDRLQSRREGTVDVQDELGKTQFGAFIAIEPKQEGTLSFRYRLPDRVAAQVAGGHYGLIVQKQPGTLGHRLVVQIDVGRAARSVSGLDMTVESVDTPVALRGDLKNDRAVSVEF
ncbi:MAG: DUF4012 domain-containing protein [Candidatus Kerfeldbacteria bacterium]|nr:DUF4012 domain-containing protein [Candidatus Kerfeldbacteria bacterium]